VGFKVFKRNVVLVPTDVLESLQQLLLLRLPVLLLNCKTAQEILLAQLCLLALRIDLLLDDLQLTLSDGYGDQLEQHFDILMQSVIGLPC
jgi:hypothetical protein